MGGFPDAGAGLMERIHSTECMLNPLIPAQAGIQGRLLQCFRGTWVPASAGTSGSKIDAIKHLADHFRGGGLAANSEPRTHMRPRESCHSFSAICTRPR